MRNEYKSDKIKYFIGNVRDYESIETCLEGVDYIFHAAALKQVPSCEFFPWEAAKTNITGTENIINAAIRKNVKKVICLSTDKAVYPINAMGISKALMEKVMIAKSRITSNNILMGTRYGNVIASRGSVIPLFISQIKNGLPLTITDPNMTRFMMSLDSAVDLVLFAFENGKPGEIFVQKAPAATIGDLAIAVKEIFEAKNEIKMIGTRHGEKLYETLLTREELVKAQDMGEYYRIIPDDRDLNYCKYFYEGSKETNYIEDYNSHNTKRLTIEEIKELLVTIPYVKNELNNNIGIEV
jgi:UDP-glucose 4-epimerase